ncbi:MULTISPECIES: ammonia-dependent NAD(+) synthetase [unclassified Arthrobacter]|uniref:ammonia-dependent NAD(+) synthetase n=1 Tax=unclassified Arthrobacter TaxID=235627 RepID=UPI001E3B49F7|nr:MULTISPECIES: ammonia-dependent NAD(+) synthetase [unclassified Arthrobacter]MCC9144108.1 ammonia-dependent NAD(+) synthetase [Arthrobacter sp. zg-Y919]MDK1275333.1 ammonia-dependent NAD(+) synthetase [Arthrobacter sp. zg.Y919]WIB03277.1 ammonia-dependent NAD(+) synthetase [Arthrobacter sp. zg-Y919]
MRKLQEEIIAELGVQPTIDAAAEIRRRVDFLKDYLHASHSKGFVLGISGGVDSTLAGKLAQLAVDELKAEGTEARFIALRLPYRVQHDEEDAQAALEFIAPAESLVYNVGPAVDGFQDEYVKMTGEKITDFNKGNIKARVRMTAQYAVAGQHNLLVIGTDHAAESVTGFFTKFGDGGADLLPLSGLDKRQNRALLAELGAPATLIAKAPTADLLDDRPGQTDETELGLSYDTIDSYLEGGDIPTDAAEKIEARFVMTRHKRTIPVTLSDTWWK